MDEIHRGTDHSHTHMGEMSRLCGLDVSELKEDPVARAYQYAEKSGGVLVLKDACTVVTDRNEKLYLNLSGNSGMATARKRRCAFRYYRICSLHVFKL